MTKLAQKICENKNIILIISAVLLVLSFIGIRLTKVNYDILVYLPDNIETIKGQNILTDDFNMGAYSVAIIENMSSKDILELEKNIKGVDGVNKVVSLYDVIGTNIPVDMLPTEITSHLHDEDTDLLFITFENGTSNEKTIDAVSKIREITKDKCKLGGMSSMVLDTMNLSEKEIFIYIVIAVIFCVLVLEVSLDSYIIPLLLLGNIGCAIVYNLGSNVFLGQISYITKALVAVLQLGVTTDFSIFLYHSYENKKKNSKNNELAMKDAIVETFKSVMGSSFTTIAGFLVLCTMQLTLGKDLGIVMAKGVLLGLLSVFTLFPSLLLAFDKLIDKTKHKKVNINFEKVNKFIVKNRIATIIIFVILLVPAFLGNKNVDVYYKIDRSLPDTLESIKANNALKEKFNIVSPEILLVSKDVKTNDIVDMTNDIKKIDGVDFILSFDDLEKYGITDTMISDDMKSIFENDNYKMLLINSTYEVASDELNNQTDEINKLVKQYDEKAILAGEGPLMKDLISISDTDFNNVNYSSIFCILIILIIVLKSFTLPIVLITAIESAIFMNMSISYFGGVTLPFVAPIVLGTIQLGATIDYAILLTTTYIDRRKKGMEKEPAMIDTLNYTSSSILVSGLCFFAATFGVGIYSKLEMVGSLCTLISRGALISMAVVIIVLPAILLMFDKLIIKKGKDKKMKNKNVKVALLLISGMLLLPSNTMALTKNETVYGKLENNGNVRNMYVNEQIINKNKENELKDYSELKDILNINGDEEYTIKDGNIIWTAKGNDIFYQGKLEKELPISVSASYKLNGKSMSVDEMLGKEGNVEITLKYKNTDTHYRTINGKKEKLYTPFVVTFGTILDATNNSNIEVSSGKVMSTGKSNVVIGIATPGLYESLDLSSLKNMDTITITYETKKFELSSMYSIVTPKVLESSDLKMFDKLDSLYTDADKLQENMNLIDESTQKIKGGSNLLKSKLGSSIKSLASTNNKNALSDEEVSAINKQILSQITSQFDSEEYTSSIANEAWKEVSKSLNANDPKVKEIVTTCVKDSLTGYLKNNDKLVDAAKCQAFSNNKLDISSLSSEEQTLFLKSCKQIEDTQKVFETSCTNVATEVSVYVAKNVSDAVSVTVAKESAVSTANKIVPALANQVANGVKSASISTISSSLNTLYSGVDELDNGINQLSEGVTKFNNEGIKKLTSTINNDIKPASKRVKELVKLGNEYKSVSGKNLSNESETKFVLVIDSVSSKAVVKDTTTKTTKTTFLDRVKNLFK